MSAPGKALGGAPLDALPSYTMTPGAGPDAPPIPPTRPRIRKLDERTIHEIAAGEVIERPASVVKELVENALDAGAHEVGVRVRAGGLELIEVADDGCGLLPTDLPVAFERHATSKLSDARDLPTVRTLGFRGEALAAIAAVSRVTLTTRTPGSPEGSRLRVEGGIQGDVEPAARSLGTTVEVRDLFFNTPARRKFLRSGTTEGLRIVELLEGLYLAHPDVSFRIAQEDRPEVRYPASTSRKEAAARVFGVKFVEGAFDFSGAAGPGLWAEGVASHPAFSRGTGRGIVLCVDGRVIASKSLQDGVRFAYHEVLPSGRFPVVLLHLRTEPGRVDVNVHPAKREVRFEREGELRDALQSLIRSRLRDQPRDAPAQGRLPSSGLPSGKEGAAPSRSSSASSSSLFPGHQTPDELGPVPLTRPLGSEAGMANASGVRPFISTSERPLALTRARPLDGAGPPVVVGATAVHPGLLVLGQVGDLYIVGESQSSPRALVLVDAHAASERVLYERLRSAEPPARQELLSPFEVELTPRQRATFESYGTELLRAGFVLEPFGRTSFRLRSVPFFRGHRAKPEAILRLLDELADAGRGSPRDPLRERVAKSAACHMAIRGGDVLSMNEMHRLLEDLYACPESFTCPHGRPIMLTLPRDRLDRWFLRP